MQWNDLPSHLGAIVRSATLLPVASKASTSPCRRTGGESTHSCSGNLSNHQRSGPRDSRLSFVFCARCVAGMVCCLLLSILDIRVRFSCGYRPHPCFQQRLWRTDVRHDGWVLSHEASPGRRCGGAACNGRPAPRTKAFPKQACRTDTAWCVSPTEIGTKGSSDAAKCTDLGSTSGRKAPCTVANGSEAS